MKHIDKKTLVSVIVVTILLTMLVPFLNGKQKMNRHEDEIKHVTGTVIESNEHETIVADKDDELHKFDKDEVNEKPGTEVSIDYKKDDNVNSTSTPPSKPNTSTPNKPDTGTSNTTTKPNPTTPAPPNENTVIDYTVIEDSKIPDAWLDGGIFSVHYVAAYKKLMTMSLDEKIGQVLIVRYPNSGAEALLKQYHFGGYVFYEKDFKGKSKNQVISMIDSSQAASTIPLLTAIDEEGGAVSRLNSNSALTSAPFKSPQVLYAEGGFDAIVADTKNKSSILKSLGLNLNFAPVVDVSTDPSTYIYKRTIGQGTQITSDYASTVIGVSKGTGVSYTLKHFPGYGSNLDTHVGGSTSKKSYADILNEDIPPFKTGIAAGAEAVMVSHNVVESIDAGNESSISPKVHSLLRTDLGFTGIIVTDDISMGAMKNVSNIGGKAISSGNDLIITSDAPTTFNQIKSSIANGSVNEDALNHAVFRLLAWKYYKGLLS